MKTANVHNLADENGLTAFAINIQNLIHLWECESSVAVKRFKGKYPEKFQAILLDKKKNNHTQEIKKIDSKVIKVKL